MSEDPRELNWEVFMPFVNVKSAGGHFDDDAFSAGFEMGTLDHKLFLISSIPGENFFMTIRAANASQADLVAMRHGYKIEQKIPDDSGEWLTCLFTRAVDVIDLSHD